LPVSTDDCEHHPDIRRIRYLPLSLASKETVFFASPNALINVGRGAMMAGIAPIRFANFRRPLK
jgi:hypothetical protein